MAKKTPRSRATRTAGRKKFSLVSLHNTLDKTLSRLQLQPQTRKRDSLISLVKKMRQNTPCPAQLMLVDLGV